MPKHIIHLSTTNEPLFMRTVTVQLAQISMEFLVQCEQEGIIEYRVMPGGTPGYYASDIRRLELIRRLRDDLDLDLPAVEVVLNLRQQVLDLKDHTDKLKQQMTERERQLMAEIQQLRRRIAEQIEWK